MTRPFHLLIIEVAVALLVLQALIINRLAGIDYPLWFPRLPEKLPPAGLPAANNGATDRTA